MTYVGVIRTLIDKYQKFMTCRLVYNIYIRKKFFFTYFKVYCYLRSSLYHIRPVEPTQIACKTRNLPLAYGRFYFRIFRLFYFNIIYINIIIYLLK